ncbi:MAG: hypothetical protein HN855_03670 [Anaerolineae bacterium]|nr:hypothetical protein [Anaerolineae bacterium]MBT7324232.1 hypothetical protein [Anaerolineae bacterium]
MSINFLQDFFFLNRSVVLFIYGQVFFILGLSIFLQSRRYSRLKLARHLRWMAAFGVLHGFHEWGMVFIPVQKAYMTDNAIDILHMLHLLLLSLSFLCLLKFGLEMLETNRYINASLFVLPAIWVIIFIYALNNYSETAEWVNLSSVWSRYLLGAPGAFAASFGLYQFTHEAKLISDQRSYRMLQIAGVSLLAYAILGGLIVPDEPFFPANILNYTLIESLLGIPVQVYRSLIGVVLAYSMIRAMEIFQIEVDQMIEQMEISTIQSVERDRIGQEIHDGVLQSIYSASLIAGSLTSLTQDDPILSERIQQVKEVLNQAIVELRGYMVSLRIPKSKNTLKNELTKLISQPRFAGLLKIALDISDKDTLSPSESSHIFSIVQEALSNIVRHAQAENAHIILALNQQTSQLSIIDDGIGFDLENSKRGFGLQTVHDHTQLLGGKLSIDSRHNQGTTITIHFREKSQ